MRADYGGTEIREALEKVFKARNGTVPTACFLLTDGEVCASIHRRMYALTQN